MRRLNDLKNLFNTKGSGEIHCFSLVCWTDGLWSIKVTDDWHKWVDESIPCLDYKYSTPELAIESFIEYVNKNNINIKQLQGD